jgi:hypothetical protein
MLPGEAGGGRGLRSGAFARGSCESGAERRSRKCPGNFQETHKEDILAKKFEEAMKKAKDAPAGKPIRDFDLD